MIQSRLPDGPTQEIAGKPCPRCHTVAKIRVRVEDYQRWRAGELIQRAMPYLTPAQREQLMTGYCDPCWHIVTREPE